MCKRQTESGPPETPTTTTPLSGSRCCFSIAACTAASKLDSVETCSMNYSGPEGREDAASNKLNRMIAGNLDLVNPQNTAIAEQNTLKASDKRRGQRPAHRSTSHGRQKSRPFCRHSRTGHAIFTASGSSSIRLVDIERLTFVCSVGAVEGCFLVVAMSMERLEVL